MKRSDLLIRAVADVLSSKLLDTDAFSVVERQPVLRDGVFSREFSLEMREVLTGKDVEEANRNPRNPRMPFPSVYGQIMSRYDALLDAEE